MKSKISILREGNFQFLKYRRAKNGSLCKGIPVEGDDVFIGNQIVKEYNIRTGSNFPLNLSHTHYSKHLERISKLAGLDFKLHNKMARKTFASILYFERKMPINLLQVLLGHQNLKDTLHYLRIADVDLALQVKEYMFPDKERELYSV
jgi:integrase